MKVSLVRLWKLVILFRTKEAELLLAGIVIVISEEFASIRLLLIKSVAFAVAMLKVWLVK